MVKLKIKLRNFTNFNQQKLNQHHISQKTGPKCLKNRVVKKEQLPNLLGNALV